MIIERDMRLVRGLSDHVVVLDHGTVIASGSPAFVAAHAAVIAAYLGTADDEVAA